jgi:hypothetical protein
VSLFQSNLRKQIRNLPKILNFVKKFTIISELFTSLLNPEQGGGSAQVPRCTRSRAGFDREHTRFDRVAAG